MGKIAEQPWLTGGFEEKLNSNPKVVGALKTCKDSLSEYYFERRKLRILSPGKQKGLGMELESPPSKSKKKKNNLPLKLQVMDLYFTGRTKQTERKVNLLLCID